MILHERSGPRSVSDFCILHKLYERERERERGGGGGDERTNEPFFNFFINEGN